MFFVLVSEKQGNPAIDASNIVFITGPCEWHYYWHDYDGELLVRVLLGTLDMVGIVIVVGSLIRLIFT